MESGSPQTARVALASDPASISDLRSPASISAEVVNEVAPAHVGARQEARTEAGPTLARTEAGPPLARTDAAQQNAGLATEMQTQGDLEEVLSIFSESLSSDASPPLAKRARLAVDDEDFDPARSASSSRFKADERVTDYASRYCRHVLSSEARQKIVSEWSRPAGPAFETPSTDNFLPSLLKVSEKDLRRGESLLYRLHDGVLDALGPLCGLWQSFRDLRTTPDDSLRPVMVSAADVLPAIQRSIVLMGSVAATLWHERQDRILQRLNPALVQPGGELPSDANGKLFGDQLLSQLKERAKLSRAVSEVKRPTRPVARPLGQHSDCNRSQARRRLDHHESSRRDDRFLGRHGPPSYGGSPGATTHRPYNQQNSGFRSKSRGGRPAHRGR